ncbi:MAG TPA: transglutaminase domain-containing protein [Opitutaceae bacterium]|nr:transglutaminase domain-containing protein [Opitutaceae bacterium]
MRLHVLPVAIGTALLAVPSFAAAPNWLRELAKRPTPAVSPDAPAVVLLDETVVNVDDSGSASTSHRVALRVLKKAGAKEASGSLDYVEKQERVRTSEAWLLRGEKTVKSVGTSDWPDICTDVSGAVINEYRHRGVSLEDQAEPGDLFGFETRVDARLLFAQLKHAFGAMLPVILERYQVRVPAGFRIEEVVSGPSRLAAGASPDGRVRTWELADRPYKLKEVWAAYGNIEEPALLLSLVPPAGAKDFAPAVFRSWQDATTWELQLHDPQCDSDAALAATVDRLVAGCPDTAGKIRALAEFVQQIRYVEVARDLGKGFGYRPRRATEVLAKGFGDCKDKANLLRAMLRRIGVVAHPVGVLVGEESSVAPDWPSPSQFNHAIVAIEVDDSVELPPTVRAGTGSRLLLFDPTNENVPFGGLPWILQGSKGELVATGCNELIDLPRLPEAREWAADQQVRLVLAPDGTITGTATIRNSGQAAADLRTHFHKLSEKELTEAMTKRIAGTVSNVNVKKVEREDLQPHLEYGLSVEFTASAFLRPLNASRAIARFDILNRDSVPQFSEKTRRTPIRLRPVNVHDEVTLRLPEGISVVELPPKTLLETPFGSHQSSFDVADGAVIFRREFVLKNRVVSVEDYPALRRFLADAAKADRAAVLLRTGSGD